MIIQNYGLSSDKQEFLDTIRSSEKIHFPPLYVELSYKSPFLVYEHFRKPKTILLESIKGTEKIARYSFISVDYFLEFRVKDSLVEIIKDNKRSVSNRRPLTRLRELLSAYPQKPSDKLPPFQGGLIGLFSYDFVHYLERLPRTAEDDLKIPEAHFFLTDRVVAFDHIKKRAFAIVCPGARMISFGFNLPFENLCLTDSDFKAIYDEAEQALSEMVKIYNKVPQTEPESFIPPKKQQVDIVHELTMNDYIEMVKKAKEYIRAGDIFQANLSQRLHARIENEKSWELYSILRSINPSPFACFADFGDYKVVGSSPERLIRLIGRLAETRPIAGTRPRRGTEKEDELMRTELLLNEKERAEHIMLIDLERNDLGKVCAYGSVTVDELMTTEDYSHVIHIVSNVRGELVHGRDAFSLVRATFPGGTITGVPKVRCMEIIDELEPTVRGPYTGSLGYIGFNGNMDLNIIIRTFVLKDGIAYVQAGAGIVADSDPEREYFETLRKAEALLSTIERV